MASSKALTNGNLQAKKIAVTTVTWTLNVTQILDGSVNSPPFTVDEASFRCCIRSEHSDIALSVEAADYCGSYFLRFSFEVIDGINLQEVRIPVDFSKCLSIVSFRQKPDFWRRWIGDSRFVSLVVTFFPENPCHSEQPNVCTCKRRVHPSDDEKCRGELHQMTETGVEAVWTVTLSSVGSVQTSTVFKPWGDSFRFLTFGNDTHLCLELQRLGSVNRESLASFKLTVHGSDKTSPLRVFVSRLQFRGCVSHECFNMKRKSLLSHLGIGNYQDVDLKIVCCIIQEQECTRSVGLSVHGQEGLDKILRDFEELFQTGQDSDVTVEVQGEKFQVHKAVLGIRCPFFANMLKHDMVEKNTGVVKIPDYTADEIKDFLLYLYTARIESLTSEKVLSLYRAADQYDVPDLKADTLKFIKWNLSVDTLGDVLALSLKYEEKELLNLATQFFSKNLLAVIKTDSWKRFGKENFNEANELHIKALESLAQKSTT